VLKSTLQKAKVLHPPSSGILVPSLLCRYKLPDASRVALEVRGHCPCGILQDGVIAVMAASMRAPLRRGPRPRPPTGRGNEAIKAKELEAWRQVALVVSPAEATTSTAGSLTSGGDHLSTDDSGHLCTGGLPVTTVASARAERSSPPSSYEGEDNTIQERDRHLRGVRRLVRLPRRRRSSAADCAGNAMDAADLRTARPSPVRWTDSRAPLGGGRRHQSHPSQGARHAVADGACSRPAPRRRSSPPPQGW
jgi:hypothetical protein